MVDTARLESPTSAHPSFIRGGSPVSTFSVWQCSERLEDISEHCDVLSAGDRVLSVNYESRAVRTWCEYQAEAKTTSRVLAHTVVMPFARARRNIS